MYESTHQHIIDEESAPGPVAAWMESSSDDSSSSSSSDSDGSSGSNTTAKRIRRMMKPGRRRRKSSFGSKETAEVMDATRTPSLGTSSISPLPTDQFSEEPTYFPHRFGAIDIAEDGDDEHPRRSRKNSIITMSKKERKRERKRQEKKNRKKARRNGDDTIAEGVDPSSNEKAAEDLDAPRRVDFAVVEPQSELEPQSDASKSRPFTLRNITGSIRPRIPDTFSQNVFTQPTPNTEAVPTAGPIPRVRYGIRRTNSLPDRLHQTFSAPAGPGRSITPARVLSSAVAENNQKSDGEDENISRTTAVFLLLISTGLVAVCAEFMVDSINAVVSSNSGLSEAFIGLIILPIVGNAAEHVTAVTVASKNKMDLAIGVAVGSSIQIALFVTPFVVLLGWCMGKEMSLYFTLFETVSLFVSAFIVNFLVLDGRSNYLEGALLCAAYVIIAVAAFFYPEVSEQSNLGGNAEAANRMVRSLVGI
jgi:Ca2+:H+ antiporter